MATSVAVTEAPETQNNKLEQQAHRLRDDSYDQQSWLKLHHALAEINNFSLQCD